VICDGVGLGEIVAAHTLSHAALGSPEPIISAEAVVRVSRSVDTSVAPA
jgi:hypothetical protein